MTDESEFLITATVLLSIHAKTYGEALEKAERIPGCAIEQEEFVMGHILRDSLAYIESVDVSGGTRMYYGSARENKDNGQQD